MLVVKSHCVVTLSDPRLMAGHLLVIPKRHVEKLQELNSDELKEVFDTTLEYQSKIIENVAPGCDIRQHYRPFLSENDTKVDHAHIHLHPRKFEDELYTESQQHESKLYKKLPDKEVESVLNLLT